MEGKDGRTERATPKKRNEAINEGNVCISPEVVSLVVLLLALMCIRAMVPSFFQTIGEMLVNALKFEDLQSWNGAKITEWFYSGCLTLGSLLAPVFFAVIIGTFIATKMQTGMIVSPKALKFKPGALNPLKNVKSLFSIQSVMNVFTSALKVSLVCVIVYLLTRNQVEIMLSLHNFSTIDSLQWTLKLIFRVAVTVLVLFVFVAAIDWAFRKYQYEKGLMMTKQEVKEEHKQQEQSPIIKRAQMKKMREFSLMRMMAAVPNANVIITNPTHVAVALEYDPETMDAPRVVAKGLRLVAQRIKKIAAENNIPIVERPEVARSLYKHVKIGREIPSNFYETVAEVLAFIHKLGRGIKIAI